MPEELQERIRQKAESEFGAAVPQGGRKKRRQAGASKPIASLQVNPDHLVLAEGSFVAADGQSMHQIKFVEVVTDAHGLAFCTAMQAAPFLTGNSISSDPLCLVTTSILPQDVKTDKAPQVIRFPAVFQPSGEPMLLTGNLINLGDSPVELAQGSIAETSSLVTGICKVSAFKDELASNWSTFCAGPVKWIINAIPALKVCQGKECGLDCPHFHPAIEESIDQMVMDLWNRQFLTYEGKQVSQEQAEVFSVLIRVPASAV